MENPRPDYVLWAIHVVLGIGVVASATAALISYFGQG